MSIWNWLLTGEFNPRQRADPEVATQSTQGGTAAGSERRAAVRTAQAGHLSETDYYDLELLCRQGYVRATGEGRSIEEVSAVIESLIEKPLHVVAPLGIYFVSSGGHQNMATTAEYRFSLAPRETTTATIRAVCINAHRPIPGKKDRFSGVARVSDDLCLFLAGSVNQEAMTIQAGIWALTDNLTRAQIIHNLTSRDEGGNTWHPISDEHCDKAMDIIDSLNIAHRLWRSESKYDKQQTIEWDGGTYVGELVHGRPTGEGRIDYASGRSYKGKFLNGLASGQGKLTWENGRTYTGNFVDGREIGGWLSAPDGTKTWEWAWRDQAGNLHHSPERRLDWTRSFLEVHRFRIVDVQTYWTYNLVAASQAKAEQCNPGESTAAIIGDELACLSRLPQMNSAQLSALRIAVVRNQISVRAAYLMHEAYPIIALLFRIGASGSWSELELILDLDTAKTCEAVDRLCDAGGGRMHLLVGEPPRLVAMGRFALEVDALAKLLAAATDHWRSIEPSMRSFSRAKEHYLRVRDENASGGQA